MLSTGQRIVTDRLHGHILAIMMKKQHELHDNNYGKNRSFHQTWTSTCPLVTFVGPGGNAERVVETPPEAEIKPALTPRKSTWVPDAPAAGTELMVARLRSRLGHELDRINLKVNHPGDEPRDQRPLVIWVHHDMDQQYMQWCTDKARTALVDCFVFVSNWQRERYLNKFGLPPERCVVLRNATEVDQTPREWRRDGVWRCAYTSTPFRGLSVLLDAWQRLSPANAELHVWSSMSLYKMDDAPYKHILEKAESTPGVIYHGLAPNDELRQALRDIHFLVYPCTFAETSCLAVIEAMAAGCRVIAPSFGALPETTGGYARIYPFNPDPQEHGITFCENLAAELASPWAGDPGLSLEQQSHCASVYNWPRRLAEWRQVIEWACKQAKTELRG
jgi:glycosyltransferase involved in cell wall biosynthesis